MFECDATMCWDHAFYHWRTHPWQGRRCCYGNKLCCIHSGNKVPGPCIPEMFYEATKWSIFFITVSLSLCLSLSLSLSLSLCLSLCLCLLFVFPFPSSSSCFTVYSIHVCSRAEEGLRCRQDVKPPFTHSISEKILSVKLVVVLLFFLCFFLGGGGPNMPWDVQYIFTILYT